MMVSAHVILLVVSARGLLLPGGEEAGPGSQFPDLSHGQIREILSPLVGTKREPHLGGGPFDGMMFPGGLRRSLGQETLWAARICNNGCKHPPYSSRVMIGKVAERRGGELSWSSWDVVHVPSRLEGSTGCCHGAEDPRLDATQGGEAFVTFNMVTPLHGGKCPFARSMFFQRVKSEPPMGEPCRIEIPIPSWDCAAQKNWGSLVLRTGEDIFMIYRTQPLYMFRFNESSCKVRAARFHSDESQRSWLAEEKQRSGLAEEKPLRDGVSQDMDVDEGRLFCDKSEEADADARPLGEAGDVTWKPDEGFDLKDVRGSTRYVFGKEVLEGDVYWSFGHVGSAKEQHYASVLLAIFHHRDTPSGEEPKFTLMGSSCPIVFVEPGFNGTKESPRELMASINSYDPKADLAEVTMTLNDEVGGFTTVRGVGPWLDSMYRDFRINHMKTVTRADRCKSAQGLEGHLS